MPPQVPEFVVTWDYPLLKIAHDLNPDALRRPQGRNKVCTDKEFMDAVLSTVPKGFGTLVEDAETNLNMSRKSVSRYLNRLKEAGVVKTSAGMYWVDK